MQIVDARPGPRFRGEVPEPRAGLRSGCIFGSKNLFFNDLVNTKTGCLKTEAELIEACKKAGVDISKPAINSCGSGLSACVVDLVFSVLGNSGTKIYDGSWSEYGAHEEPKFV